MNSVCLCPGGFSRNRSLAWISAKAVTGHSNQLFLGVEYQYWQNKLGTPTDENVAQLWVMWRL